MYVCTYIYIYIFIFIFIFIYLIMHACTHAWMHVCMCVCMYVTYFITYVNACDPANVHVHKVRWTQDGPIRQHDTDMQVRHHAREKSAALSGA